MLKVMDRPKLQAPFCRKCDESRTSGKFCWKCGDALIEGVVSCQCGYENIWPHEKFCPECGRKAH